MISSGTKNSPGIELSGVLDVQQLLLLNSAISENNTMWRGSWEEERGTGGLGAFSSGDF